VEHHLEQLRTPNSELMFHCPAAARPQRWKRLALLAKRPINPLHNQPLTLR
jgi:hypothetical protein